MPLAQLPITRHDARRFAYRMFMPRAMPRLLMFSRSPAAARADMLCLMRR